MTRQPIATEAERYGRLALVAMNFHIQTGNPAELTAAYVYTRLAVKHARRVRRFVPCYVDRFQALDYTLVAYVWTGEDLIARFADGRAVCSIYKTVEELIRAGIDNYLERVREVHPETR